MSEEPTRGTLRLGEPHPAAYLAMKWINSLSHPKLMMAMESLSACAIEGNRLGEVCAETLDRIFKKQPVSDRYLLALCWTLRDNEEKSEIGITIYIRKVEEQARQIQKLQKELDQLNAYIQERDV